MNFFKLKRSLNLTLKNQFGWKTEKKIIVFSVDDYGNIRMASKEAREKMREAGLNVESNRFDRLDALENEEDLDHLYETLSSVKDKNDNPAIFTTFSLPANPDFEKIIQSDYSEYFYEPLHKTYKKIEGYGNVLHKIKQGIDEKLILPQFHGREHLSIKVLLELLKRKDKEAICSINNRSLACITSKPFSTIGYTSAFAFTSFDETENHKKIIEDGLNVFEEVYGYRAKHFTAPGNNGHTILESILSEGGIEYIDTDFIKNEHQGNSVYKRKFNYTGKKNKFNQLYFVRNCVYEPLLNPNLDWEDYCMMQIEIAFKYKKVANISSHRVNFGGHIEQENREIGLKKLRNLLKKIIQRWPDVEFMSTVDVGNLISQSKN